MKITLKEAVDIYVDVKMLKGKKQTEQVRQCLQERVYEDIKNEIIKTNRPIIEKEVRDKIREKQERERIKQLKILLIETVVFGVIVGLLGSQFTDLISASKGVLINIPLTLLWVIICTLITLAFAFIIYIDKIGEFFMGEKNE